jgi:flagellar protein FliT
MDHQKILSIYQEVADITKQMLVAAKSSDWDSLISLEKRCADHIVALRKHDRISPLSDNARQQKISIIKKILADDNEIRTLTEPRLAHLSSLVNNTGNERKLHRTYNAVNSG